MLFQIRIQNLGKLADATVRVGGMSTDIGAGGLTVLAGANNTGKSFCSKFLYSALDAMGRENLVTQHVQEFTDSIRSCISSLEAKGFSGQKKTSDLTELAALARQLGEESELIAPNDGSLKTFFPDFVRLAEEALAKYRAVAPDIKSESEKSGVSVNGGMSLHERLKRDFDGIACLAKQSGLEITLGKINSALVNSLIGNFQVPNLSDLKQLPQRGIFAEVEEYGSFVVDEPDAPDLPSGAEFDPDLLQLVTYSGLIYLESPVLWKLQVALEDARRNPRFPRGRINGVPRHFYDLADALRGKYSGKVAFPEVLERLTGEQGINGKIMRDEFGNMSFHEKKANRMFPLTATAMGVANLGVLALLIERKILTPGTVLFIDEPESNLHPEWQVVMAEALWELTASGVHAVIATHSADILKRLQVYAHENADQAGKLVAVNHFRRDGTVQSGGVEKILDVQEDLSDPFFQLYKRGLS